MTSRRDFLQHAAGAAAALGTLPLSAEALAAADLPPRGHQDPVDLSWINRITGKHRAVFDVPEIESGYGVWRATIWINQYHEVLGIPKADMSAVVVLRHNGIALAMQQPFWDRYGIGKRKAVLHPITQQPTDRNPVLLSSARQDIPPALDAVQLDQFIGRGGIALACALAFADCVDTIKASDQVDDAEARRRATGYLVPGVILQPSGVFAALRAQEAGCAYLRAS